MHRKLFSFFSLETTVGNAAFVFYGFPVVCVSIFLVDGKPFLGDEVYVAFRASVNGFL